MQSVCLQVGEYANFVGAHYWNFQLQMLETMTDENLGESNDEDHVTAPQERYVPSTLFRSQRSERYEPRSISVDFHQNFGRRIHDDINHEVDASIWSGAMQKVEREDRSAKNIFLSILEDRDERYKLKQKHR